MSSTGMELVMAGGYAKAQELGSIMQSGDQLKKAEQPKEIEKNRGATILEWEWI